MRNFHLPLAHQNRLQRYTNGGNRMIDITTEQLLTMPEVAALLPGRPSLCQIWRWRTKGVRGRKLETVIIGGRPYTSRAAVARFCEQRGGSDAPAMRMSAAREKAIAAAEKELAEAGI
jgi:hypothetical protein